MWNEIGEKFNSIGPDVAEIIKKHVRMWLDEQGKCAGKDIREILEPVVNGLKRNEQIK